MCVYINALMYMMCNEEFTLK